MHQHVHDLRREESLYFLHIHKTAGSSMRRFITEHFDLDDIADIRWTMRDLLDAPREALDRTLIAGHYGHYLHQVAPRPLVYITMLRDPVERTLSAFSDMVWREDLWLHDHIKDMTIDEFVHDDIGVSEFMNFQTRSLAFDDVDAHFKGYSELWREPERYRAVYSDRALLDKAIERLNSFAFVGVQDQFDDSLKLLAHTFGWLPPKNAPRVNVRRSAREDLSERTLERIREFTQLDQELYEHAHRLFSERFASIDDAAIADRHAEVMGRRERCDRAAYRFERGLDGAGWRERREINEWSGRWTGPETESTLSLPLARGKSYTLRMIVGSHRRPNINKLSITANGRELKLTRKPLHNEFRWVAIETKISRWDIRRRPAYLELGLKVPKTYIPADKDPKSKDTRGVGLYVVALEVVPAREKLTFDAWCDRALARADERRAVAAGV